MRLLVGLLSILVTAACGWGPTDPPGGVPESRLSFVRLAESAPPLMDTVVSFWAVRGEDREVVMRLAPTADNPDGEEFLEFDVPGGALFQYPDGRRFAPGDSVRITITAVDPSRFLFRFEPAGLKFNPEKPASLEVSYQWAERDSQGRVVEEQRFSFWRQERPGALWFRVATVKFEDLKEAEAEVFGFTRYALASN